MRIIPITRFTRQDLISIEQAVYYIDANYSKHITTEDLSEMFNINSKKLQLGMKHKTGSTVHEYLVKVRIKEAMRLLQDPDESLKAIKIKTGFYSTSHLVNTFKQITGKTPIQYRLESGN